MKKIQLLLLLFLAPTIANATLLGRVNSYYDPTAMGPTQETKNTQKGLDDANAYLAKLKGAKEINYREIQEANRDVQLTEANYDALKESLNARDGELKSAKKDRDQAKKDLEAAKTDNDKNREKKKLANLEAEVNDKQAVFDDLDAQVTAANKKLGDARDKLELANIKQKHLPSENDIKNAQEMVKHMEDQLKLENGAGIVYPGDKGVKNDFAASVSVASVTGGGNAIDLNAYQYTIPLWKAACEMNEKEKAKEEKVNLFRNIFTTTKRDDCTSIGTSGYRFVPMYVLLHKSATSSQTAASNGLPLVVSTLTNDLLDNEYGGLVNLKFTPSIYDYNPEDPYVTHFSFIVDLGYKYVEQPTPDLKTIGYANSGYIGLGLNFEFSIFDHKVDTAQLAQRTAKPAGHLAVGFGFYRNKQSGVNNSFFASPVPGYYNSLYWGGELQITNVISAVFSHTLPITAFPFRTPNPNPLGSYTSIAIRFQN